jgi:hypothetical protein
VAVSEPGLECFGCGVQSVLVRVQVAAEQLAVPGVGHDLPALHRAVTGVEHHPVQLLLRGRLTVRVQVPVAV